MPEPTLHKKITCGILTQETNFFEKNNLYNVVLTMCGQHFIGIVSSQCCPNMSETTLEKKNTCRLRAHGYTFAEKLVVVQVCLVVCFLTMYTISPNNLDSLFSVAPEFIYGLQGSNKQDWNI